MIVGVIGVGTVGGAMLQVFRERGIDVIAYDKHRPGFTDEDVHFDAFVDAEMIFVSVPTQTRESGNQDLDPLEETLRRLELIKYKGIVVSKCTTIPGTTRCLANKYSSLRVVHYPEFLTASHAYEDFKYQKMALLSGKQEDVLIVAEFLRDLFPSVLVRLYSIYAATEIAKYTHNCLLATKLSFLNEIFDICKIYSVSYDEMISGVVGVGKIGESHVKVPGSDGRRGWSGACFPKDTKAFLHVMKAQGVPMDTLSGAVLSNQKVRGES